MNLSVTTYLHLIRDKTTYGNCMPCANVPALKLDSISSLFSSTLGVIDWRERIAIDQAPVARFHQGGGFQPVL